jgi:hypothetical protein
MNAKFICAIACVCTYFNVINAQTNTFPTTGNAGVGTLSPATTLQVIGKSRFGGTGNYAQFDETGNFKLVGSAIYKIDDNKYAFQSLNNINYGLFLNATDKFWEFKDSTATPVFKIGTDAGNVMFKGGLSVGKTIIPPANGLFVSGKVGIGTSTPEVKLQVTGGNEVSLTGGGSIITGFTTDRNLAIDNNEIQARNNSVADKLLLNKNGGNVGIGTSNPIAPLNIDGGGALSLKGGGFIVAGSTSDFNLGISNGAIQARNNGAGSLLTLNKDGGDVVFGGSVGIGGTPSAKFHVLLGTQSTLTDGGYIVAGFTTLNNIVIDNAGMQARNNGQAQVLNLNPHGGTVYTPEAMQVGSLFLTEDEIDFGAGRGPGLRGDLGNTAIKTVGNLRPDIDNLWNLGSSFKRWTEVWSVDGSINTSDARDKTNIRDLNYGLKEIMKLHPIRFNWKNKTENGDKLGLIAQDLQRVLPEVVKDYEYKKDSTGKTEKIPAARLGVMYADIIPVLVKGMQQQQQIIEEQNKKIETLTQLVNQLMNNNAATNNESKISTEEIVSPALLEQNAPNPFNANTIIRYSIPSTAKQSSLIITNVNGQTLKTFSLNNKGVGQITIYANQLAAGNYFYFLLIDGRKTGTRKMVLTK